MNAKAKNWIFSREICRFMPFSSRWIIIFKVRRVSLIHVLWWSLFKLEAIINLLRRTGWYIFGYSILKCSWLHGQFHRKHCFMSLIYDGQALLIFLIPAHSLILLRRGSLLKTREPHLFRFLRIFWSQQRSIEIWHERVVGVWSWNFFLGHIRRRRVQAFIL